MKKTIVVLADSIKKECRCLAGKELVREQTGWKVGSWIRPVSTPDGSEVSAARMKEALGREPRLLEILEISFTSNASLPDQPENWLIDAGASWRSIDVIPWGHVGRLVDKPRQLWDEGRGWRRVRQGYVQRMPQPASLYLIKPEEIVSVEVWSEPHPATPPPTLKRHRLAKLRYGGVVHEFDITDPAFADQYYRAFPAPNDGRRKITLRAPMETLVCISLTPEFRGYHYKIAAAFLEPPLRQ